MCLVSAHLLLIFSLVPLIRAHIPRGAFRIPVSRSFRQRPPISAAPSLDNKVFDAHIATSELHIIRSKYRDAGGILKGIGGGQELMAPSTMYAFSGDGDELIPTKSNLTSGSSDQDTADEVDEASAIDSADNATLPITYDNSYMPSDPHAPARGRKRRCSSQAVNDPFGFDCGTLPFDGIDTDTITRWKETKGNVTPAGRSIAGASNIAALPDPGSKPSPNGKSAGRMPLTDFVVGNWDVMYYGPMKFGFPPQELQMDIDTGSADLWIPVNCADCDTEQFKPELSPTFQPTGQEFKAAYGSGWAEGYVAQDSVEVDNLVVRGQHFGAVRRVSDELRSSPAAGLLGLAFGSISVMGKPTFFEGLLSSGQLASPMFSVHLTRGKKEGSELCVGCMDETKFRREIYWMPLKSKSYWAILMTGFSVDGEDVQDTTITAAIDTGSTLVYLPMHIAESLYTRIPGAKPAEQYSKGFWTYPCSARLDISLRFDPHPTLFSIHPWDFNLGRVGVESDDCVGGILGLPEGFPEDFAVIGDEFLKNWYSIYDYSKNGRVGFAFSVNNE